MRRFRLLRTAKNKQQENVLLKLKDKECHHLSKNLIVIYYKILSVKRIILKLLSATSSCINYMSFKKSERFVIRALQSEKH